MGEYAVVNDANWHGRIKVVMEADGEIKSYYKEELFEVDPMRPQRSPLGRRTSTEKGLGAEEKSKRRNTTT